MSFVAPAGIGSTGRVRTWVLSLAGIVLLAGLTVFVLSKNLNPPDAPVPPSRPLASADAIVGTVTLAQGIVPPASEGAVLFVIARKAAGAPLAVARIPEPRFPQPFRIGPDNVMMAGTPLEGTLHLSARLSRGGSAGPAQSGDLEGDLAEPVAVGSGNVVIVLSRTHP